jgi:hypothetical protein
MLIEMEFLWTSNPTFFIVFFMTCLLGVGSALMDVSFNVIHDDKVGRSDVVQRLTMISVIVDSVYPVERKL